MQSFIERRSIINYKKRQEIGHQVLINGGKSITTPNSPRRTSSKGKDSSHKSNNSYVGNIEEIKIDNLNIALKHERLDQAN